MKADEKEKKMPDIDISIENITGNEVDDSAVLEDKEINIDDDFFSNIADDLSQFAESDESADEDVDEGSEEETDKQKDKEEKKTDPELEELKKYKDFIPLLQVMMEDPNLVNVVKNYLTGEQQEQKTQQTDFELPEDFIFDFEEAVKDPNSDSGKLLERYVQSKVKATMDNEMSKVQQERLLEEQKAKVMKKFGASKDDVEDLIRWSMNTPLTLEDAYYLKNRAKIEKQIAKNAINNALKKKSVGHRSLGSKGKAGKPAEPELELFNMIKNSIEFGGGALE